ncbi:Na+/H+ antiporter NhaD type [Lachnospiraceae bacterium TWA4]|nr:Na+/H+ antiporter NhaD type [Lachnospiraceae bacterium TWA4]
MLAGISLIFVIIFFYFAFRKQLQPTEDVSGSITINPNDAITNKRYFFVSTAIFLLAICLLVTHAMTGLTVAFIGTFIAILTLIAAGKNALELLKKVDYATLSFFIGLFVVVGGLEQTGVLETIAAFIEDISGGNGKIMVAIIIWISGVASALVDNIPFSATMVPVISSLSQVSGVHINTLAWALSMGTDIGGSATPIGASANVVGIAEANKAGYKVSWGKYCKTAIPATIIVLLISNLGIWLRYF